jgi:hypothetical protein
MSAFARLTDFLKPWNHAFSNSTAISTTVVTFHIIAMLFAGGLAIAADRTTLRALRTTTDVRRRQLEELAAVHRPVLIALAVLFTSGVLLATSDIETFALSPLFWLKLSLVTLLMINGAVLERTESRLRAGDAASDAGSPLWRRLRTSTYASLTLWTATAITGVVLANVS